MRGEEGAVGSGQGRGREGRLGGGRPSSRGLGRGRKVGVGPEAALRLGPRERAQPLDSLRSLTVGESNGFVRSGQGGDSQVPLFPRSGFAEGADLPAGVPRLALSG